LEVVRLVTQAWPEPEDLPDTPPEFHRVADRQDRRPRASGSRRSPAANWS